MTRRGRSIPGPKCTGCGTPMPPECGSEYCSTECRKRHRQPLVERVRAAEAEVARLLARVAELEAQLAACEAWPPASPWSSP